MRSAYLRFHELINVKKEKRKKKIFEKVRLKGLIKKKKR